MTRGNQREKARAKNMAEQAKGSGKQSGDPKKRNEENARALAEKVAAKRAAEAAGGVVPPAPVDPKSKVGVAAKQAALEKKK